MTDHEFGGQHTEIKLSIVEGYLKSYATALRPKFKELWYIDAFAGTGARTVRTERRGADLVEQPIEESSGAPPRLSADSLRRYAAI